MAVVTIFIVLGITGAEASVRIMMVREQVDEVNAYVSEDKLFVCVAHARLRWEGGVANWLWQLARGLIHPFGAAMSPLCWSGVPNTQPQAIGGGVIWAYASIAGTEFLPYMNAMRNGLGL
jgi:hypothetical protein